MTAKNNADRLMIAMMRMHQLSQEIAAIKMSVMEETDNRHFHSFFEEKMETSFAHSITLVKETVSKDIPTDLDTLRAFLYLQELEEITPAGKVWRTIADEESHFRVSVKAIKALRSAYPAIGLVEAKLLIESYNRKEFK